VADDGTRQVVNLFGLDLVSQDSGSAVRTLLVDGLGSVRLEMVAGVVETATMYEPYGEVLEQVGTSGTVYGFTGEQEDSATGLLYLRARYYSPQRKVFQSRDPWEGTGWRPATLNYYTYVQGNPVIYTDPAGYWARESAISCSSCIDQLLDYPQEAPLVFNDYDLPWFLTLLIGQGIKLPFTWSVVLMPPQSQVAPTGPPLPQETQLTTAGIGIVGDELEFILILLGLEVGPAGEFTVAGFDVGATLANCYAVDQCYFGQPEPTLPPMLVFNQDVILNFADFTVSWTVVVDLVTTSLSILHDTLDAGNAVPNAISIGFTPDLTPDPRLLRMYVLVYPDGGTEWSTDHWRCD